MSALHEALAAFFPADDEFVPLVAIKKIIKNGKEEGVTQARDFSPSPQREQKMCEWAQRMVADGNGVYFAVNPIQKPLGKKASKENVKASRWLYVDKDPPKDIAAIPSRLAEWRAETLEQLQKGGPIGIPPTLILDSGRGYWGFWRLREPVPFDGPERASNIERVEACGRSLEAAFDADSCHNIDRVARLPGFVNLRTGQTAMIVEYHPERTFALGDFPRDDLLSGKPKGGNGNGHAPPKGNGNGACHTPHDFVAHDFNNDDLEDALDAGIRGIIRDGVPVGRRSEMFQTVICACVRAGLTRGQTLELLSRYPDGIAAKYRGRLETESNRSWDKAATYVKPNGESEPYDFDPETGEILGEKPQAEAPADRENFRVSEWLKLDLPPRDYLIGEVMCTTSRFILFGETGVGKTLLAACAAGAIAAGAPFLGWEGRRPSRVMYLDGEMPAETLKERVELVTEQYGPDIALYCYNRDRLGLDEMPPLNTPKKAYPFDSGSAICCA